ncbi:hypothetical protein AAVH_26275 [Aphelenchoides avenae]|nr:hypothetical protein AAVH_26275 [Aphelenchus avenae]
MVGQNWVGLEDTDTDVGVAQQLGQSFIQQLKLHIGGLEVSDSTKLYPYISYLRNELFCSPLVKKTTLAFSGYYKDTVKQDKTSEGFKKRVDLMRGGRTVEFRSRLEFDLANQGLFMLNNLDLVFTIYRNNDKFLVHSLRGDAPHIDLNTYRLKLTRIRMQVKYVDVQPSVNVGVLKTLEHTSAKYHVRRTEPQSWFLTPSRKEFVHNVYTNIKPRRMFIAMTNYDGFNGSYTRDPFNFEHFKISELVVHSGGYQYPAMPYEMEFWNDPVTFARPYQDMINNTTTAANITNGITPVDYSNGFAVFVIPMTSTLEDCEGMEPVTNTNTTVAIKFSEPVPSPGIELICIGEFDEILYIDHNRGVTSDSKVG